MDLSGFSLEDKVAIVTGGSRGIGRAIALALADAGARVAVCARKVPALEKVSREINAKGVECLAVPTNVRRVEELSALVDATLEEFGRVDVLVNNAGTNFALGGIMDVDEKAWDVIMNTNVKACFVLSKLVGAHMIGRGSGSIINVASSTAFRAAPLLGCYSVSKAALVMLTRVMASEWAHRGVRVNCIAPGLTRTEFSAPIWGSDEVLAQVTGSIPLGRIAEPDEVAGTVVFLASEAARYITGQTVLIDGGASTR